MDKHSCSVAVIGAGAAGLVAARELRAEGHRVVVFEQSEHVGGVWVYDDSVEDEDPLGRDPRRLRVHSSMYDQLRTNLPREIMSFSDFPLDAELLGDLSVDGRQFCGHAEVRAYLQAFADYFRLGELVRTRTQVAAAQPLWRSARDAQRAAAAVATPPTELAALFAGDDDDTAPLRHDSGPRWLVTTRPMERGPCGRLQPASNAGGCGDSESTSMQEFDALLVCNGHYSQPNVPDVPGTATFPGRILHSHNYRSAAPYAGQVVLLVGASNSGEDISRELADVADAVYLCARATPAQAPPWSASAAAGAAAAPLPLPSGPRRNLHRAPMLQELCPDGSAVLADGRRIPRVDAVIFCTGYQYCFDFLDGGAASSGSGSSAAGQHAPSLVSTREQHVYPLWQHMYTPAVGPSLAFIGLPWKVVPFPQFELQSRLAARVLSGAVALPSRAAMALEAQRFYEGLRAAGVPAHHTHMQGLGQFAYNDKLHALACPPRRSGSAITTSSSSSSSSSSSLMGAAGCSFDGPTADQGPSSRQRDASVTLPPPLLAWREAMYQEVGATKRAAPDAYKDMWTNAPLLSVARDDIRRQVAAIKATAEFAAWQQLRRQRQLEQFQPAQSASTQALVSQPDQPETATTASAPSIQQATAAAVSSSA